MHLNFWFIVRTLNLSQLFETSKIYTAVFYIIYTVLTLHLYNSLNVQYIFHKLITLQPFPHSILKLYIVHLYSHYMSTLRIDTTKLDLIWFNLRNQTKTDLFVYLLVPLSVDSLLIYSGVTEYPLKHKGSSSSRKGY